MFVNTWLSIKILLTRDTPPGGWILKFLSDNTSALGWMAHESRTRRLTVQNIARVYAAILTCLTPSIFTVITEHVTGVQNDAAEALSRPSQFTTWSSTRLVIPELSPLTAYRILVELLSHLHWLVSVPQTGDLLESTTTILRSLDLTIVSNGANQSDSQSCLSSSRHKRRQLKYSLCTCKR